MNNGYSVVKDFELAVKNYTGSAYCVAVNSCTSALYLCLMWHKWKRMLPPEIEIPKLTYPSVAYQIMHAGCRVKFREEDWQGQYQLAPLPIWDSARRFSTAMFGAGTFQCTSHHWGKILGIQQGGCILHDTPEADKWFRRARFDGRTEGVETSKDRFDQPGWHFVMTPEIAAEGLMRLSLLPKKNEDQPRPNYPDLSQQPYFR